MKPDRVVVGVDSPDAAKVIEELYTPFVRTGNPLIVMDIPSAEMTKYAANAMLATRISFMNQIAQLCEAVGADVTQVRRGIGSDRRIGQAFLFPGPGYGGARFSQKGQKTNPPGFPEKTPPRIFFPGGGGEYPPEKKFFLKNSP